MEKEPKPYNDQNQSCRFFKSINDHIPARLVLYFLSWSGFLVSFMMRNDINFALVVMVRDGQIPDTNMASMVELNSTVYQNVTTNQTIWLTDYNNRTEEVMVVSGVRGEFDWSSTVQSIVISSFYWCYVLSQVVGGVATEYFGTKNVFGWSQLVTAICSLCIPYAAYWHYNALIVLRSIQGVASGLTWPAMYAIVGYWIPPVERSRFMSSFQGFSIGIGLTYPLCGFIIAHWGWHSVFYTTGTIGVAWSVMWYFFAFNTPAEHPRITAQELEYIELNIDGEIRRGQGMRVPWLKIFTSLPAWSIGITTFGRIWVHYTFIMSGPMYMEHILGVSIQKNGLLSGLPFICSYISSVIFCWIADTMMQKRWMTLTNIRKLFTALSQIVPGCLCLLIGLMITGNVYVVITVWFIAVTFITASYAGAMANIVDIAPNLAGPVLAFAQTIHMTASFLSPIVSGLLLTDKKSPEQWMHVFGLASIVASVTYIMYQIYGTADIQTWNYPITSKYHPANQKLNGDGSERSDNQNDSTDGADRAILRKEPDDG